MCIINGALLQLKCICIHIKTRAGPLLLLLPSSPPPSRFLHCLILIMQLRFCEALFMLRMNAAHSLVFFATTPSPPLPSANDSSRRSVESHLHTESSSHGCTTRKNDSKKRLEKMFQKNGWCGICIFSLQSFIETEVGSIYEFTSKLPLHSVATQDKITMKRNQST